MRYAFEKSIVAGYTEDARAEVNQCFEYVGNIVPLLKRIHVNSMPSITSSHPFHLVPLVERLHSSFKEQY